MNKGPINYRDWLDLGRVIIPCYKGKPKVKKYTDEDFKIEKDIWNRDHGTAEIALRLDNDVDLDIDNELVKNFINYYVSDCGAIFGREGNPSSHYLWSNKNKIPFKQFSLPDEFEKDYKNFDHGAMICELRTERKRYTIVPGSLHSKDKTNVRWEKYQEIKEYEGNLSLDIGKVALSAALTIIYPGQGKRDEYCTAIAGILLKNSDWTEEQIDLFVLALGNIFLFNWIGIFQEMTKQISNDMLEKIVEYGADRYYVYLNVPEKDEIFKRRIIVSGATLMNQKLFYEAAMSQARAWLPRQKATDFEKMMVARFNVREKSENYVKEAEDDSKFKRMFLDYLDTKGVYTDKEQLFIHKLPYYNPKNSTIEFDLNNFEKELAKNRVNMVRVDLVMKVQNILQAKKYHGKYKEKSCPSWKIQGEKFNNKKIIWEGESVVIGDEAGGEEDEQ